MKDRIEKIYNLQQKNFIYSGWIKELSVKDHVKELQLEVQEALDEAEKEDWEAFKDEMGDALWDCLGIIANAERQGKLTMNEVLDHIYAKFTERKPYLLEERHVTKEEESKLWKEIKEKQKNARNRS